MITLLFVAVLSFVLMGFFAGAEMAYLSFNRLKLRHLADEGNRAAQMVMRFNRHPNRFLTNILIGTNLMHVTFAGIATYLLEEKLGVTQEWLVIFGLSLMVTIFAETIPKDWFRHKADDFIYRFAPILNAIDRLLSGVSFIIIRLTDVLTNMTVSNIKKGPYVTREEFRYVIEESAKKGVLLANEQQLINTILNLSSRRIEELMIPVSKFPKVSLTDKIKDVKEVARKTKTQAVLVYEEIPSLIVGIVYVFDVLFEENEDQTLSRYLKAPLFMTHDTTAEKAIFILQSRHASFGAVINADREVMGVVGIDHLIQF